MIGEIANTAKVIGLVLVVEKSAADLCVLILASPWLLYRVCDVTQRLKVKQNKEEEKKAKEEEEEEEVYEEVQEEEEVEDDEEWEEEEEDGELEEGEEDEEEVEEEEDEEVDEKEKEEAEDVREETKEKHEQKERQKEAEGMELDTRGAQAFRPEMDTSVSGWPCFVIPAAPAVLASDDEDMSPEDLEVAEILKHLPPIVPTRRELPKSWQFENHH